jgi:hypothetical protein
MGSKHNPIPYHETVDLVDDTLNACGLRIAEEAYGVLSDGSRMFGLMQVEPAREGEYIKAGEPDYGMMIGLRGSYDQTFPRGFACGARVFVCDNLSFSGDVTVHTKQTTNIGRRMPDLVYNAIEQIADLGALQARRFDEYKANRLSYEAGNSVITDLLRAGVIGSTHIVRTLAEWDEPSHEAHMDGERRTVWTLHNAVTEAIKPAEGRPAVISAHGRTIPLTVELDRLIGLDIAAA